MHEREKMSTEPSHGKVRGVISALYSSHMSSTHTTGRSNDKDQPPPLASNTATTSNRASDPRSNPRTPRPPVRSATLDTTTSPKQVNSESHLRPEPERTKTPNPPGNRSEQIERSKSIDPREQQIKDLETRIRELEAENQYFKSSPYQEELLSIRTHLQVNDLREPWEISQKFQAINKEIENISRNLSESLADQWEASVILKASDFLAALRSRSAPENVSVNPPVSAEDFVDFGCRALINKELMYTIFNCTQFHPALEESDNKLLIGMYSKIREQESQVIAGRWRVSSFNSHQNISYPYREMAITFCQNTLLGFCAKIYGDKPTETAINTIFPQIETLFMHAWTWYSSAKSSVIMLDFQPYYSPAGSSYEPENLALEGRKPQPPSSGNILLTTRLGLKSSQARGGGNQPDESFQMKATVLAAEYFLRDR